VAALVLAFGPGLAVSGRAQPAGPNLLQNPGFHTDLAGWTHDAEVTWTPEDANGSPASGSARLFSRDPYIAPSLGQCVPVTPGTRYRAGVASRWQDGTVDLVIRFHAQADCLGTAFFPVSYADVTRRNVWSRESVSATAPVGAVSAFVLVSGVLAIFPSVNDQIDDFYFMVEPPTRFFTLTPCRVIDRAALRTGADQVYSLFELGCGVPRTARAVAVNLTVISRDAVGHLGYYTAGPPPSFLPPTYSALNFGPGQTRATSAVIDLNDATEFAMYVALAPVTSSVDVIVDVNGYFE
jgi:hypothetical protein